MNRRDFLRGACFAAGALVIPKTKKADPAEASQPVADIELPRFGIGARQVSGKLEIQDAEEQWVELRGDWNWHRAEDSTWKLSDPSLSDSVAPLWNMSNSVWKMDDAGWRELCADPAFVHDALAYIARQRYDININDVTLIRTERDQVSVFTLGGLGVVHFEPTQYEDTPFYTDCVAPGPTWRKGCLVYRIALEPQKPDSTWKTTDVLGAGGCILPAEYQAEIIAGLGGKQQEWPKKVFCVSLDVTDNDQSLRS